MKHTLSIITLLAIVLLVSCEKDKKLVLPQEGYIKVNISGKKSGNNLDYSDSYSTFNSYGQSSLLNEYNGYKSIYIERFSDDLMNSFSLQIILDSLNNISELHPGRLYFSIEIKTTDNTIIAIDNSDTYARAFQLSFDDIKEENKISNIKFDSEKKRISGDFTYSYQKEVDVDDISIEGSFNVQLYEYLN